MRLMTALVGLALALGACSRGTEETLPGGGPVAEFQRRDHWLLVFGSSAAAPSDLVNLNVLQPFHPGLTPAAAVAKFGRPSRKIPLRHGAEYVEYNTEAGRFRIGKEESAGGYVGHPLYFYPNDRRTSALFPTVIVAKLRSTLEEEVVLLFDCRFAQPFMHVVVKGGQVDEVVWQDPRDIARRTPGSDCVDPL